MEICGKVLKNTMILFTIIAMLMGCSKNIINASSEVDFRNLVKVGVVVHKFTPYMNLVRQNLEEIQKQNNDKVEFIFLDSQDNEALQDQGIDELLQQKNIDVILLNLVNTKEAMVDEVINKIKGKNIPVILFFYSELAEMNSVKEYEKAFVLATDSKQAGTLEGKIIVDLWKRNKISIDKDGDNIMEYVMLTGPHNKETDDRSKYAISAINNAGIKTKELESKSCNWDYEIAKAAVESIFLKYNDKIEAIISNNDNMAIGAVDALQKYGYNKGDKAKDIVVVGIDAITEARDYISKGFMTGTVFQDPHAEAEALYTIGMNLYYGREPTYGMDYKPEKDKKIILMPFQEYKV